MLQQLLLKQVHLLALCLLIGTSGAAQKNYQQSRIVNNNGDTLLGYIEVSFSERSQNPETILFTTDPRSKNTTVYKIDQLTYFEVIDQEVYRRCACTISTNETAFSNLTSSRDTANRSAVVWLRQLSHGNQLTLYAYTDAVKTRFYVSGPQQEPVELIYFAYLRSQDEPTVVEDFGFRRQLARFIPQTADSGAALRRQIELTQYREKDLLRVVNLLNGTTDQHPPKLRRKSERYFLTAGINRSTFDFYGDPLFELNSLRFKNSYLPLFGGGVDFLRNPVVQKSFIRIALDITGRSHEDEIITKDNAVAAYRMNQLLISGSFSYLWNLYRQPGFRFYIGAGMSPNLLVALKNEALVPIAFTDESTQRKLKFYEVSYHGVGHAGAGFGKRWELGISYHLPIMHAFTSNVYDDRTRWLHLKMSYALSRQN